MPGTHPPYASEYRRRIIALARAGARAARTRNRHRAVRFLTNGASTRCSASRSCCATLLTVANRVLGRVTAPRIASASLRSGLVSLAVRHHQRRIHKPHLVPERGELARLSAAPRRWPPFPPRSVAAHASS